MIQQWVGDRWGEEANLFDGVKLLVLGESAHHTGYDVGTAPESSLIETLNRFLRGKDKWRFYRMLTSLLANKPPAELTADDLRAVWDGIAFFNYVPVVAARGPRARHTQEMFNMGAAEFNKFLKCRSPQAILVCGKYNWYWFLNGCGFTGKSWETPFYHVASVPAGYVQHPSSGFSRAKWRPVVDELLRQAQTQIG